MLFIFDFRSYSKQIFYQRDLKCRLPERSYQQTQHNWYIVFCFVYTNMEHTIDLFSYVINIINSYITCYTHIYSLYTQLIVPMLCVVYAYYVAICILYTNIYMKYHCFHTQFEGKTRLTDFATIRLLSSSILHIVYVMGCDANRN